MAIFGTIILSILILQASSKAAPNADVAKNLDVETVNEGPKLDDEPYNAGQNIKVKIEGENNGRQKRYYDYVEFGFPPFFESNFPFPSRLNYNKRDESQNTGVYGSEDTLLYILRSLQRILNDARRQQSTPKPPRVHVPTYIPVFYLPQAACNCPTNAPPAPVNNNNNNNNNNGMNNNNNNNNGINNNNNTNNNNNPQPPPPTIAPSSEEPTSVPDLPNRINIDDMRQNWGTVVDQDGPGTDYSDSEYDDGNRPISLDPIEVPESLDIPAPPVEHGSVQAGAEPLTTTTTMSPALGSDKAASNAGEGTPSLCDAAIVSCCVRKTVTYNCFALQGCPDPSFYGNPCEPQMFRQVLNRVHAYVKQRNG